MADLQCGVRAERSLTRPSVLIGTGRNNDCNEGSIIVCAIAVLTKNCCTRNCDIFNRSINCEDNAVAQTRRTTKAVGFNFEDILTRIGQGHAQGIETSTGGNHGAVQIPFIMSVCNCIGHANLCDAIRTNIGAADSFDFGSCRSCKNNHIDGVCSGASFTICQGNGRSNLEDGVFLRIYGNCRIITCDVFPFISDSSCPTSSSCGQSNRLACASNFCTRNCNVRTEAEHFERSRNELTTIGCLHCDSVNARSTDLQRRVRLEGCLTCPFVLICTSRNNDCYEGGVIIRTIAVLAKNSCTRDRNIGDCSVNCENNAVAQSRRTTEAVGFNFDDVLARVGQGDAQGIETSTGGNHNTVQIPVIMSILSCIGHANLCDAIRTNIGAADSFDFRSRRSCKNSHVDGVCSGAGLTICQGNGRSDLEDGVFLRIYGNCRIITCDVFPFISDSSCPTSSSCGQSNRLACASNFCTRNCNVRTEAEHFERSRNELTTIGCLHCDSVNARSTDLQRRVRLEGCLTCPFIFIRTGRNNDCNEGGVIIRTIAVLAEDVGTSDRNIGDCSVNCENNAVAQSRRTTEAVGFNFDDVLARVGQGDAQGIETGRNHRTVQIPIIMCILFCIGHANLCDTIRTNIGAADSFDFGSRRSCKNSHVDGVCSGAGLTICQGNGRSDLEDGVLFRIYGNCRIITSDVFPLISDSSCPTSSCCGQSNRLACTSNLGAGDLHICTESVHFERIRSELTTIGRLHCNGVNARSTDLQRRVRLEGCLARPFVLICTSRNNDCNEGGVIIRTIAVLAEDVGTSDRNIGDCSVNCENNAVAQSRRTTEAVGFNFDDVLARVGQGDAQGIETGRNHRTVQIPIIMCVFFCIGHTNLCDTIRTNIGTTDCFDFRSRRSCKNSHIDGVCSGAGLTITQGNGRSNLEDGVLFRIYGNCRIITGDILPFISDSSSPT